jgi:tetratricopeptide (TPR) repeat protein
VKTGMTSTEMTIELPAKQRYEELLVSLHREMKAGRGAEERADELREELAALWPELDAETRRLVDELSEDLYVAEGKRHVVELSEGETVLLITERMKAAFHAHENREALSLLRKLRFEDHLVGFVFGRCWERLGFARAAVELYDFAYEREARWVYAIAALEALVRAGMVETAADRAREIANTPIVSGSLLLQAASVLHRTIDTIPEPVARDRMYRQIVAMVEAAWTDPVAPQSVRANGLVTAGFCYEHLGEADAALLSFSRAANVYPSEATHLAHGVALLKRDRARALRDFTKACELQTQLAWPYLYATEQALREERFGDAERFALAGIARTNEAEIRGRLLEWAAIAGVQLGRTKEETRSRFERAQAELPFDDTIRRNAIAFEDALRALESGAPAPASAPKIEEVKAELAQLDEAYCLVALAA